MEISFYTLSSQSMIDEVPDTCIHGMYPPEKCTICIKKEQKEVKLEDGIA